MLYLYPDTMGPEPEARNNALAFLSRYFTGDFVAVWWVDRPEEASQRAAEVRDALGAFAFHWTHSYRYPPGIRHVFDVWYYVTMGLQLRRRGGPYDVIVAYGPFRTALAGLVLRRLIGSKLIIEIPGNYWRSFTLGRQGLLRRLYSRLRTGFVLYVARRADHLRLLYPGQVPTPRRHALPPASIFHEFTPLSLPPAATEEPPYILFLGYPWFLKGVDVLIKAFNRIAPQFPDIRLKIVGHCPDRTPFLELAAGNPRIEFEKGTPRPEAMRLMAGCSMFVLPSRSEAMGRVLLEAMAARKPIVATAVDGIPHYVTDGENGLLVPAEDVEALAHAMERLLADPAFARELASRARERVFAQYSEERYATQFRQMVDRVVHDDRVSRAGTSRSGS